MTDQSQLADRSAIIELVDSIFDTVDAKDWEATERLFTDKVYADFTSLAGGEPAELTNVDLVGSWRAGMHAKKSSFHFVGHYNVTVTGDEALVKVKGYTYNALDASLGGAMWEVWGLYEFTVRHTADGWKAAAMKHIALNMRGDIGVRNHTLQA